MQLGFGEMLFIGILALLIFGPKKLPEIGRQVGRALAEFKRASDEFKSQIQSEINKIEVEERTQTVLPPSTPVPEAAPLGSVAAGSLPAESSSTELTSHNA
jgi:sec-independent protein translocase protein TatB